VTAYFLLLARHSLRSPAVRRHCLHLHRFFARLGKLDCPSPSLRLFTFRFFRNKGASGLLGFRWSSCSPTSPQVPRERILCPPPTPTKTTPPQPPPPPPPLLSWMFSKTAFVEKKAFPRLFPLLPSIFPLLSGNSEPSFSSLFTLPDVSFSQSASPS